MGDQRSTSSRGAPASARPASGAVVPSAAAPDANPTTTARQAAPALRPDLLGYVFHLAWIYLFFYEPDAFSTAGGELLYVVSVGALVLVLLAGTLRTRAFMRLAEGRASAVAAPLLTAGGTLLYWAAGPSPAVCWVAGVATGAGSAALAARWASVYGNVTPGQVVNAFPTVLVTIVAMAVTLSYLPSVVLAALLVVLPLLSGACLAYARHYQHRLANGSSHGHRRMEGAASVAGASPHTRTFARVMLVPAALVCVMSLLTGLLDSLPEAGAYTLPYNALFYCITAVLVLVYVGLAIFREGAQGFLALFCAPVAVLAVILMPYATFSSTGPTETLFPIGNVAFELVLLFAAVLYALTRDVSPAHSFMAVRCTRAVFDMVGYYGGVALLTTIDATAGVQIASVVLFAGAELLVVALVLVGVLARSRGEAGGNGAAPTTAGAAGSRANESAGEPYAPQVAPSPAVDPCAELARKRGLSERELEVLRLLAAGKTSADIQQELCIAQGTTNYHLRNIYAKTGVHSRQELLVLGQ